MKKTMLKLISLLLAVVFVYGAVCPVVIAAAAYENEAAVYGTNLPAEEETEDIEEEEASLPPFLQFLINILEKLANFFGGDSKEGGPAKFFTWLIKLVTG
ncbi:MAG: hypothetical protein II702_11115 [Clostridia bacterium]|nr:hypothetical protein [Clostridia bacterium]